MNTLFVPLFLVVFSVVYTIWAIHHLRQGYRVGARQHPQATKHRRVHDIMGRSHVSFSDRSHNEPSATPQTAIASEHEKSVENKDIFAVASVPNHPRQIAPEDLDAIFGDVPEGEDNTPLDINYPLYEDSFPDMDTDGDAFGEDTEDLPLKGARLAQGVSFEEMGEVYRHLVHESPTTAEQREDAGRILLGLKQTDMFEAMVSGHPDGNDKVNELIDTYLSAFHRRMSERAAESQSPQGVVPSGFDVRNYV